MRGRRGFFLTTLLALTWLAGQAGLVAAQVGVPGAAPQIQSPTFPTPSSTEPRDPLVDGAASYVSFLDSAVPHSQMRIRFEDATRIRQPMRAEFILPKNGLLPETGLDYQDLTTYGEVRILPSFSTFMSTPLRFVNADVNKDNWGLGDIDLGFKWAFWSQANLLATFQFRTYVPTAIHRDLGTHHVSLEPALLVNYQLLDYLTLEGEARFWAALGGSDFAGDVFRYGIGLSYGKQSPQDILLVPVIELVGWTVVDGKSYVAGPGTFGVEDAAGNTIINLNGGLRLGLGNSFSFYAGYGRALTGRTWYKDIWRLEFRFFF